VTTPVDSGWKQRYSGALMNTFGPPKLVLAKGLGAHIWDVDGKQYVDLYAGIAVNALGHAHPALVEAVHQQLLTLGHVSNLFASQPQIELAERLLSIVLGERSPVDGRVFFTNSGTEACEAALKLTRRTGRMHVVAAEGSFHGRTMGALSLTSKAAYREPFEPLPGGVTFVPYGDPAALAAAVTDETAAVVLEPIQGEAGVITPPLGYLEAAREITAAKGALLWLDEIQTGMGRTGTWLAHHNPEVCDPLEQPDIITLAKGLGGGIPIGACVAVGHAAHLLQPGDHGSTFGGNPVATAASLAVMRTIESEGLLAKSVEIGKHLVAALDAPGVRAIRAAGSFIGVDLDAAVAPRVVAVAQAAGFLINSTGPDTLRLAPSLALTEDDVLAFAEAWPTILTTAIEGSQ
jgi:acetylornithine/N-succinyldiaminopimelate aminotransferase